MSNCQAGYIETFLAWSGLSPLFKDFECWGRTGLSKSENLAQVIRRNSLRSPLFVGDTTGDAEAAAANGVLFAFAQYGFGKVNQYDFSAHSFPKLCEMIISNQISPKLEATPMPAPLSPRETNH